MTRYAIAKDSKVENVVEWDGDTARWRPPSDVEAVALADDSPVAAGWSYDGTSFAPPVAAPRTFAGTTLDFMRLFTPQEVISWNAAKAAVAAMTPQDYADPSKAALAQFSYFNALFVETNTIDTSRADLQAGLDVLIAVGVIAADRKAAIIAGTAP